MTHTPGPWSVGSTEDSSDVVFLNGLTKPVRGLGPEDTWIDCMTNANARLIAAAPDMLEVLKELEESVDYWSDYDVPIGIQDRIRAAIAKAEGKK